MNDKKAFEQWWAQSCLDDDITPETADPYIKAVAAQAWHAAQASPPAQPVVLAALQAVSDAMYDPKDGIDFIDKLENLRPVIEDALSTIAQPVSETAPKEPQ
tara:strand:- start:2187 stop:2492 length:306 start_codon:yes stop_codon:yes gene_type:complete